MFSRSQLRFDEASGRKISAAATAVAVAVLVAALGPQAHGEAKNKAGARMGRTEIGSIPWNPARLNGTKVIYGTDDRIDVYDETDALRQRLAKSVCGLVYSTQLEDNGDGTSSIRTSEYQAGGLPACEEEPFGDQPTAPFCTGFLVASDLIVTAGHCFDDSDLTDTRFVFGFVMEDASNPVLDVNEDQIYRGIEVVSQVLSPILDYSVVRLDRAVVAPGVHPLDIRRDGTVQPGTAIGVIGHPAGLPLKIAFGDQTQVIASDHPDFFLANLDTYGGNSGSPIFNAVTGVVEGILVRGEQDFDLQPTCFVSHTMADAQGLEECTKITRMAEYIPLLVPDAGILELNEEKGYTCEGAVWVTLRDANAVGVQNVRLTSAAGDTETLSLFETGGNGVYTRSLPLNAAAATPENGILEVGDGGDIAVEYTDIDTGAGERGTATDSAIIDCSPPEVSDIRAGGLSSTNATVTFNIDESASATVFFGPACAAPSSTTSTGVSAGTVQVGLANLLPLTTYFFTFVVTDSFGNSRTVDNDGGCFSFTTLQSRDFFTERFDKQAGIPFDLANRMLEFTPDASTGLYTVCLQTRLSFPTTPAGGTELWLFDDDSAEVSLADEAQVSLFGTAYTSFFVGSNGSLTFGQGSPDFYNGSAEAHFSLPRLSLFFGDLDPTSGGVISWRQLTDRVAVTYASVPEFRQSGGGPQSSFQAELFFDGRITMTYLSVQAELGIVGLSEGFGTFDDFVSNDFEATPLCEPLPGCSAAARPATRATGRPGAFPMGDILLLATVAGALTVLRHKRRRERSGLN